MAGPSAVDADDGLSWCDHRRSLPCVRVVAGDLRGRRIEAPTSEATRPTTDKVREAVFNSLRSLEVVEEARVLDLFAGTGAMGIEAISRGAAHCTFVENDRAALVVLKANIAQLGIAEKCTVMSGDAVTTVQQLRGIDLLIADPPYGFANWAGLLERTDATFLVLESDRSVGEIAGFETVREKRYGRTHVSFLRPIDASGGTVEGE